MSTVAERTYTPEDLLSMPDRKNYELFYGHLVELREKDERSGEDVLPGFRCRLGEIFPRREAEALPSR